MKIPLSPLTLATFQRRPRARRKRKWPRAYWKRKWGELQYYKISAIMKKRLEFGGKVAFKYLVGRWAGKNPACHALADS